MKLPALFLATALALVGCAGAAGPRPGATSTPVPTHPTPTPSPALVASAPPLSASPVAGRSPVPAENPLDLARQTAVSDLTNRLGVSSEQIEVVTAEPVSWPDSSLGCPQPDTGYTQAMVEGYRVILGHGSRVYLYHAGGDAITALCHSGEKDGGHDFVPPPGFDE